MLKFAGKPVSELIGYMTSKMPPGNPGSLGDAGLHADRGFHSSAEWSTEGDAELPADVPQLSRLMFPGACVAWSWPKCGTRRRLTPGVKLPPPPAKQNPLDKITPVSDAMLQNPPAGDWLTWRRGFDYQGFSPLKQITKSNVNNLRVAWTWTLPPGANEATPLVHDGVMFVHGFGDHSAGPGRRDRRSAVAVFTASLPKGSNPRSNGTSQSTATGFTWAPQTLTWSRSM